MAGINQALGTGQTSRQPSLADSGFTSGQPRARRQSTTSYTFAWLGRSLEIEIGPSIGAIDNQPLTAYN